MGTKLHVTALILAALVLALGTTGCGGPPTMPLRMPATTTAASASAPKIARAVESFDGVRKTKLFAQSWIPTDPPVGTVLLVHGLKDHSTRYDAIAERLANEGFAVYAFDLRGHGRSEGERVWVEEFDDYVEDVRIYFDRVAASAPGKPVFVFGHSMGGAIVTRFALAHPNKPRGIVLSAGALGNDVGWFKTAGTKTIAFFSPHAGVFNLDLGDFSRDPKVVAEGKSDPLVYQDGAPAHTAVALLGAIDGIEENRAKVTVPMLVLHGDGDKVTPISGSRELVAKASSRDKTLTIYPGLYHDLLHEPEHAKVEDDIVRWMKARVSGS